MVPTPTAFQAKALGWREEQATKESRMAVRLRRIRHVNDAVQAAGLLGRRHRSCGNESILRGERSLGFSQRVDPETGEVSDRLEVHGLMRCGMSECPRCAAGKMLVRQRAVTDDLHRLVEAGFKNLALLTFTLRRPPGIPQEIFSAILAKSVSQLTRGRRGRKLALLLDPDREFGVIKALENTGALQQATLHTHAHMILATREPLTDELVLRLKERQSEALDEVFLRLERATQAYVSFDEKREGYPRRHAEKAWRNAVTVPVANLGVEALMRCLRMGSEELTPAFERGLDVKLFGQNKETCLANYLTKLKLDRRSVEFAAEGKGRALDSAGHELAGTGKSKGVDSRGYNRYTLLELNSVFADARKGGDVAKRAAELIRKGARAMRGKRRVSMNRTTVRLRPKLAPLLSSDKGGIAAEAVRVNNERWKQRLSRRYVMNIRKDDFTAAGGLEQLQVAFAIAGRAGIQELYDPSAMTVAPHKRIEERRPVRSDAERDAEWAAAKARGRSGTSQASVTSATLLAAVRSTVGDPQREPDFRNLNEWLSSGRLNPQDPGWFQDALPYKEHWGVGSRRERTTPLDQSDE
jgi:hypothetical protein